MEYGWTAPEGKVFGGWTGDPNGTTVENKAGELCTLSSCDLYAIWVDAPVVQTKNVTFHNPAVAADGSVDKKVTSDNWYTTPEDLGMHTPEGKVFAGWTGDPNGNGPVEFGEGDELTLSGDISLYAVWKDAPAVSTLNVTYINSAVATDSKTNKKVAANDWYTTPADLGMTTPEGKVFAGWSTDLNDADATLNKDEALTLSGDVQLYAVWADATEPGESDAVSHFTFQSGSYSIKQDFKAGSVWPTAEELGIYAPQGTEFAGWSMNAEATEAEYKAGDEIGLSGDATLYAVFTKVEEPVASIHVVYHYQTEDTDLVSSGYLTENDTLPSAEIYWPAPEGMEFAGWTGDPNGTEVEFKAGEKLTVSGEEYHLYAIFTKKAEDPKPSSHVIFRYIAEGTDWVTSDDYAADDVLPSAPALGCYAPEGYEFAGWTTDPNGSEVEFKAGDTLGSLSGDIQLYAIFTKKPEQPKPANHVIFRYIAEGTDWVTSGDYTADDVLPSAPALGCDVPEGTEFAGWTTDPNGSEVEFKAGDTLGSLSGDIQLYAIFTKVEQPVAKSKITFVSGTQSTVRELGEGDFFVTPEELGLGTPAGMKFAGWSLDVSGDQQIDYKAGDPVSISGEPTLYAVWVKDDAERPATTHLIFHNDTQVTSGWYNVDADVFPTAAFLGFQNEDGLVFKGWSLDEDAKNVDYKAGETITLSGDAHLYAVWGENETPDTKTYTVTFKAAGMDDVVETVKEGETVVKPNDPVFGGYTFTGWSTSADEFQEFDFSTPITEDIVLTAFFTQDPVTPTDPVDPEEPGTTDPTVPGTTDDGKKDDAKDDFKSDGKKDGKKDDSALPQTGDPTFMITTAASLTGAVAVAVGLYSTKRRQH